MLDEGAQAENAGQSITDSAQKPGEKSLGLENILPKMVPEAAGGAFNGLSPAAPRPLSDPQIQALIAKQVANAKRERFIFLLAGRTGVGKSSSVNSLMGKEVAPVGDWVPTTMKVEAYDDSGVDPY